MTRRKVVVTKAKTKIKVLQKEINPKTRMIISSAVRVVKHIKVSVESSRTYINNLPNKVVILNQRNG